MVGHKPGEWIFYDESFMSPKGRLHLTVGYLLKYWFVSLATKDNSKRFYQNWLILNYKVVSIVYCNPLSILVLQFFWFCLLDRFCISSLKTCYSGDTRQMSGSFSPLALNTDRTNGQWNRSIATSCQFLPKSQLSREAGKYRNVENIFSKIRISLLFSDSKNDTCSL